MKKVIFISLLICQAFALFADAGSKLIRTQQRQEKIIRSAYKRQQVTENEYRKLMDEQRVIKHYIHLADADHYWNRAEIKRVSGKLDRAESRLKRYKHNWED